MRKINFVTLISGGLLLGCSPLQQAPLVYSSKVSVGVDVSATSTETPGAGVTIGSPTAHREAETAKAHRG